MRFPGVCTVAAHYGGLGMVFDVPACLVSPGPHARVRVLQDLPRLQRLLRAAAGAARNHAPRATVFLCPETCPPRNFFCMCTGENTHMSSIDPDVTQRTKSRRNRMRKTSAVRLQAAMRRSLAKKKAEKLGKSRRRRSHLSRSVR